MSMSGGNLKKDKIIIQIIFCLGQIGVLFFWVGTPNINTCIGMETVLIGNYLYPLCVVLFEYLLWERWRPNYLLAVYGALFLDALLVIYIWWKRYSFFIGDILFEMRYILPGYYAYLVMMAVAFIITVIYIKKRKF